MLTWNPDPQPNGMGWMSSCKQFSVRQCDYSDGRQSDFWTYYRPAPGAHFMPLHPGQHASRDDAMQQCYQYSEKWRHECEVMTCIKSGFNTPAKLKAHCDEIAKQRGSEAAKRLYNDVANRIKNPVGEVL